MWHIVKKRSRQIGARNEVDIYGLLN